MVPAEKAAEAVEEEGVVEEAEAEAELVEMEEEEAAAVVLGQSP